MSEEKKHYQRPLNFKTGKVEMNFGAGGKASAQKRQRHQPRNLPAIKSTTDCRNRRMVRLRQAEKLED